jgi:phosphate transport system substrate-binding protein
MKNKLVLSLGISALIISLPVTSGGVEPSMDEYKKVSGISGKLSSVGSDTLANLMTLWAEEFKRTYPNVSIQIQAAGSSTAPPALTESTSNIGPMSRKMKSKEMVMFEKQHGYKPLAIGVAIDALAIYVNKDNPITKLTIPQVDAIFSENRACGMDVAVKLWSDLGVSGLLAEKSIQRYGRNSVSGTYGFFKKKALCKGDFSPNVNEQPGSASVVQSVSASLNGIGYSGIGYKTAGVKALYLSKKLGKPFINPTSENAINGSYPLARVLYIYVNKQPNKPLDPVVKEFLNLVLSKQGQNNVVKDGYIPLPATLVEKYRSMIN